MHLNIKTRLAFWHMAIVGLILAGSAFGADLALRRVVLGHVIDDAVLALAEAEAAALQASPRDPIRVHEVAPGTGPPEFVRLDKFVQIVDREGRVLARSATLGTARLPVPGPLLARLRAGETVFETVRDFGEEPVRMVSLPVTVKQAHYAVQVAMSLDDAYAVLRAGRWLFLGMALAILIAVGPAGMLLVRKALRPIDLIVRRARRIGDVNLSERLPHPGTSDELGLLVETLNDMLARLDRSFEVQRRFTADASHELRSPLSRLRAELEVTLRRPRAPAEYEEALRSCLEEVERLQRLTEELLVLARIDAAADQEDGAAPVPLSAIIEMARAGVERAAGPRDIAIAIDIPPDLSVSAAPGPASIVVANVLQNAVKFSPPGGQVKVLARAEGAEAVVAVSDSGPGVTPGEIERLFERFYRGSASRVAEAPGLGLGLAISRSLVEAQGGRITIETVEGGGATFRIHLPLAR